MLYQKYGKNAALKRIFERVGETQYNHQRLIDELRALLPAKEAPERAKSAAPKLSLDEVAADDPRIIPLYRERQHLHAQLMVLPTDLQRKQAAFRIIQITQMLDKLQAGEVPLEQRGPMATQNQAQLLKKLLNNRAYISKYRNKPEKQHKVQERIAENQRIEKLLK